MIISDYKISKKIFGFAYYCVGRNPMVTVLLFNRQTKMNMTRQHNNIATWTLTRHDSNASSFNFFPHRTKILKFYAYAHCTHLLCLHTHKPTQRQSQKSAITTALSIPNVTFEPKKNRMNKIYSVVLLLFFAALTGCKHNCSDNCAQNGLDENCCPKTDESFKPLPRSNIKTVNIFLETSGSMAGYMPTGGSATEFQKIIHDIVDRINGQFPNGVKFYSIYNSNTAFKLLDNFTASKNIISGTFSWSGSTYLPTMLDSTLKNYMADSAVNIFISDCIFSPEKKDTKETELATTDIRSIFKPFAPKFSSTVFCLYSEFRSAKYQSAKSPYYLILLGNPENIQSMEPLIIESVTTMKQIYEEVNYGLHYVKPYYSVLSLSDITSNFIAYQCDSFQNAFVSLKEISLDASPDSMKFWIGVNLKGFPSYAVDTAYLKSNLNLTVKGKGEITAISRTVPKGLQDIDKPFSDKCTHFIQVRISELNDCVSTLQLSLKYSKPQWIENLTEPKDEYNRSKTFGLDKIDSGLEQAYKTDENPYFFKNLTISLIKK